MDFAILGFERIFSILLLEFVLGIGKKIVRSVK